MEVVLVLVAALWVGLAALVAHMASQKERPAGAWFLIAVVVSPVIALLALGVTGQGGSRRCADCAGTVSKHASVCPHCRRDLTAPRPLNAMTRGNPKSGRKTCKACGTVVNRDAVVCECGRDFERSPAPTRAEPRMI